MPQLFGLMKGQKTRRKCDNGTQTWPGDLESDGSGVNFLSSDLAPVVSKREELLAQPELIAIATSDQESLPVMEDQVLDQTEMVNFKLQVEGNMLTQQVGATELPLLLVYMEHKEVQTDPMMEPILSMWPPRIPLSEFCNITHDMLCFGVLK